MKRLVRILAIAAVVAGTAVVSLPASAGAGTYTKILTPKGPGQPVFQYYDLATSTGTINVSGQTSIDITTNVNIYCFTDSDRTVVGPLNSAPIPVNTGTSPHTFSATGLTGPSPETGCILRAVPDTYTGISGTTNSGYVAAFAGPTFYFGVHNIVQNSSSKTLYSVQEVATPHSLYAALTPDAAGIFFQFPTDNFSETPPQVINPSIENLSLRGSNVVSSTGTVSHSEIVVDNVNAYLPDTLDGFVADHTLVPSITVTTGRSASTGNVTSTETVPLRTCGATYPQSAGTCTTVGNPGVSLRRSVVMSSSGAVLTVKDSFISTNNAAHNIRVEYLNLLVQQSNGQVGVKLPGRAWGAPPSNQTITNLPTGPHTIFVNSDLDATDGQPDHSDQGITYSGKPTSVFFNDGNVMALRYNRTVPKAGAATMSFGLEVGFSLSTVTNLANAEQKALTPHLALTAPTLTTSDNTPTIRGRVTNATNGLPAKVTITIGTKSKTVNVSGTGTFAVTWTFLVNGKHTAKAKATDPSGFVLRASRTFKVT